MWTKKNYMKLAEEEEEAKLSFWGVGEVKFSFFQLESVEFVWIWIVISWGWNSFWTSFFLKPST